MNLDENAFRQAVFFFNKGWTYCLIFANTYFSFFYFWNWAHARLLVRFFGEEFVDSTLKHRLASWS